MVLGCAYHGGHPDHRAALPLAELTVQGLDVVVARIDPDKSSTMGLAIATKKATRTTALTIVSDEVIALDADQSKPGITIGLGALAGITDDFGAGVGGMTTTEGEGTLTLLLERDGQRHLLAFTGPTGAVLGFGYGYQVARVRAGKPPLPGLLEVDAVRAAGREAHIQEEILAALRELVASR